MNCVQAVGIGLFVYSEDFSDNIHHHYARINFISAGVPRGVDDHCQSASRY